MVETSLRWQRLSGEKLQHLSLHTWEEWPSLHEQLWVAIVEKFKKILCNYNVDTRHNEDYWNMNVQDLK
jgi:hypothetical protein